MQKLSATRLKIALILNSIIRLSLVYRNIIEKKLIRDLNLFFQFF